MSEGTVLIVDGEPDMVENCARILRRAGYHCLTATDPHRALALLESDGPDLLLTDLKMPGMDGMELLRRARLADRRATRPRGPWPRIRHRPTARARPGRGLR